MKPLNGDSYVFSAKEPTQVSSPFTNTDQILKDITNRVMPKPNKQKLSKSNSKLSGSKRANEGVHSVELARPPDKIQSFNFSFGSGPFVGGPSGCRPPDPPDVT